MTIRIRRCARSAAKTAGMISPALLLVVALSPARPAAAQRYVQTNLVTDGPPNGLPAANTDPQLVNPWGIARSAASPWWVADNGTGLATLYNGAGSKLGLVVTIPESANPQASTGVPSGQIFNTAGGTNFAIDGNNTNFLFVTEDGTISGWGGADGTTAKVALDNSGPVIGGNITGAVYKGLAIDTSTDGPTLYAADFGESKIEAYSSTFAPITLSGGFVDPDLAGDDVSPFNIANIDGDLFVTYAQIQALPDELDSPGFGAVAEFDANGNFIQQIATGTAFGGTNADMDAPWGLALAPSDFGKFSNDLLVGEFGNGHIDAFNISGATPVYEGELDDVSGNPLSIDGLWGLEFGGGTANNGPTDSLYFSAGTNNESDGVFGTLTAATPEPGSLSLGATGLIALVGLIRRRTDSRRRTAA